MAQKRIPMRMCAICRTQLPKKSMIRLVKSSDGAVTLDETGKKPGRGLYVCHAQECVDKATKGSRLEKAAGYKIAPGVLDELRDKVDNGP